MRYNSFSYFLKRMRNLKFKAPKPTYKIPDKQYLKKWLNTKIFSEIFTKRINFTSPKNITKKVKKK